MQQAYRCHLTVIASWQAYQATTVSGHLYICGILRKEVNQSCPMYLSWHFQPPPYTLPSPERTIVSSWWSVLAGRGQEKSSWRSSMTMSCLAPTSLLTDGQPTEHLGMKVNGELWGRDVTPWQYRTWQMFPPDSAFTWAMVNHDQCYVDPLTGVHTNWIESR